MLHFRHLIRNVKKSVKKLEKGQLFLFDSMIKARTTLQKVAPIVHIFAKTLFWFFYCEESCCDKVIHKEYKMCRCTFRICVTLHWASSITSCIHIVRELRHIGELFFPKQVLGAKLYRFLLDNTVTDNSFYHMIIIQEVMLLTLWLQECMSLFWRVTLWEI